MLDRYSWNLNSFMNMEDGLPHTLLKRAVCESSDVRALEKPGQNCDVALHNGMDLAT